LDSGLNSDTESDSGSDLDSELDSVSNKELDELMKNDYSYPEPDDPNFQEKIYRKREFYPHKIEKRNKLDTYEDIKKRRYDVCRGNFKLREQQSFLGNYINPDTPFGGVLIFHGTGTGKTCAAISIAEKFKDQVSKYGTKIHVVVPGPFIKENWYNEIIKCAGKDYGTGDLMSGKTNRKKVIDRIQKKYKFLSYKGLYKRVIGEKIKDYGSDDSKAYIKTETGEFERDISVDRIYNLNNSILIIDEAHNITGNYYGKSLMELKKNSVNLKIILLTATPMTNYASEMVELVNFIRPIDKPMSRDKIFTSENNYSQTFKQGGPEYLRKMCNGYISYLRGADPITFAKRVDVGEIPPGLQFTKVVRCYMEKFQRDAYQKTIDKYGDSGLDTVTQSASNMVFPGISKSGLEGFYGISGMNEVKNQLKMKAEQISKLTYDMLNDKSSSQTSKDPESERDHIQDSYEESTQDSDQDPDSVIMLDENNKIMGSFMDAKNLKHFSIKFSTALNNLNRLIDSDKGSRTAFVYSNMVVVGIEIFQNILIQNGYLEYNENPNKYFIRENTRCYYCGKPKSAHKETLHKFNPATFFTITGGSTEDGEVAIPAEKQYILDNIFSNIKNKEGKYIKFVLGSPVMTEGLSLKNVSEVHILDSGYTLGKIDQIIGRAIRYCSHYDLINDKNRFPEVSVFKYVVSLDPKNPSKISNEEDLYRKAEKKYITVKKTERLLKEIAIDCPLNRHGNLFEEELEKFKDCTPIESTKSPGKTMCPAICDYTKCNFRCSSSELNKLYFDDGSNDYRDLQRKEIQYNTFSNKLASSEMEHAKTIIKNMFGVNHIYTLKDIIDTVKMSYGKTKSKQELFDEYFCFKALDELTPLTKNDFNNFKDIVYDKYLRRGYIIFVKKYYIFQPFSESEDAPMYYRTTYDKKIPIKSSLSDYLMRKNIIEVRSKKEQDESKDLYEFSVEYYDKKKDYYYVGILDGVLSDDTGKIQDIFKVRKGMDEHSKKEVKKRGKGILSFTGSACLYKKKEEMDNMIKVVSKMLNVDLKIKDKRKSKDKSKVGLCNEIMERLMFLEKYASSDSKSKIKKNTYYIVPNNHPAVPFPFNLEDRVEHVKNKILYKVPNANITVKTNKIKKFNLELKTFRIIVENTKKINDNQSMMTDIGFKLSNSGKGGTWILDVD